MNSLNFYEIINNYGQFIPVIIFVLAFIFLKPLIVPKLTKLFYKGTLQATVALAKKDPNAFLEQMTTASTHSKEIIMREIKQIKKITKIHLQPKTGPQSNSTENITFEAEAITEQGSSAKYLVEIEQDLAAIKNPDTYTTQSGIRPSFYKLIRFQRIG